MNERLTKRENEGLPKRENYEDEDQWDEAMWQHFADKVVITREELEAYESYRTWDVHPDTDYVEFELDGKQYKIVVLRYPNGRPSYDWYTRIFVVKKK